MAVRRDSYELNIWPGFVDLLSTLLMVMVFVLTIFVALQLYLNHLLDSRDATVQRLTAELHQLKQDHHTLQGRATLLETDYTSLLNQITFLENNLKTKEEALTAAEQKSQLQTASLEHTQQQLTDSSTLVTDLRQEIVTLSTRTHETQASLTEAQKALTEKEAQIQELTQRLNKLLAQKVEELAKYRSEFFGRLREVLGERPNIRIVGDRFIFQSEVLFETASSELGEKGKESLKQVALALKDISVNIPTDIPWVLRVDGHTDKRPIHTSQFRSNWELSTARAIAVVNFFIEQGIPPQHLAAAGFAEFQPLKERGDLSQNRRIEVKLDQR